MLLPQAHLASLPRPLPGEVLTIVPTLDTPCRDSGHQTHSELLSM